MMKKTIALLFFISLFPLSIYAQEQNAKKLVIDAFYGGPNLVSRIIQIASLDNSTSSISGIGPFGVRAEYFVSEVLSVGLEVHHARSGYKRQSSYTDGTQTYYFKDELSISRTRIYPRLALHMVTNNLDIFWHGSLGFVNWSTDYKVLENTNGYYSNVEPISIKSSSGIAIRTGVGFRYFFNKNIGINGDLGLGGPLFTAGLSCKF